MIITSDRIKIYHQNYGAEKVNENVKVKENTSTALSVICMKLFKELLEKEGN